MSNINDNSKWILPLSSYLENITPLPSSKEMTLFDREEKITEIIRVQNFQGHHNLKIL